MKFILLEDEQEQKKKITRARGGFLYHVCPTELSGSIRVGNQGIHLAVSPVLCKTLAEQRGYTSPHYYKVMLRPGYHPSNALRIEADPMNWTSKDIARLLLAKLDNKPFEASSKGITIEGDSKTTYKYNNNPSLIHIENLTEKDRPFLETYANMNSKECTEITFRKMAAFIRSKGFDSIIYHNYGESNFGDRCFIIFRQEQIGTIEEIPEPTEEDIVKHQREIRLRKLTMEN